LYELYKKNFFPYVKGAVYHYTCINNLLKYIIKFLDKGEGIYNAVDKEPISSEELYKIFKSMNKGNKIRIPKKFLNIIMRIIPTEILKIKLGILNNSWYYSTDKKIQSNLKIKKTQIYIKEYFKKKDSTWQ